MSKQSVCNSFFLFSQWIPQTSFLFIETTKVRWSGISGPPDSSLQQRRRRRGWITELQAVADIRENCRSRRTASRAQLSRSSGSELSGGKKKDQLSFPVRHRHSAEVAFLLNLSHMFCLNADFWQQGDVRMNQQASSAAQPGLARLGLAVFMYSFREVCQITMDGSQSSSWGGGFWSLCMCLLNTQSFSSFHIDRKNACRKNIYDTRLQWMNQRKLKYVKKYRIASYEKREEETAILNSPPQKLPLVPPTNSNSSSGFQSIAS